MFIIINSRSIRDNILNYIPENIIDINKMYV